MKRIIIILALIVSCTTMKAAVLTVHSSDTIEASRNLMIGDSLNSLGKYPESLPYYKTSSSEYKESGTYEKYVYVLNKYANALRKSRKVTEAKEIAESAIANNHKYLEDNDESKKNLALSNNILGVVYMMRADYTTAEEFFLKSRGIHASKEVIDSVDIANSDNNLGISAMYQGNFKKSLRYHLESIKYHERQTNPDPILTSSGYNNLGQVYERLNKLNESSICYSKALKLERNHLGSNHIKLAGTYNNIGLVYESMGRDELSLDYLDSALQIRLQNQAPDHPHIAQSYDNMGAIYERNGQQDLAHEYLRKALDIRITQFDPMHPIVGTSYHNVGQSFAIEGNNAMALEHLLQALKIRNELGKIHPDIAETQTILGEVYANLGMRQEALKYQKSALEMSIQLVGAHHPAVAASYFNIAESYLKWGSVREALSYLELAANTYLRQPNTRQFDLARTYNKIGQVYLGQEQYLKALDLFEKAIIVNSVAEDTVQFERLPEVYSNTDLLESYIGISESLKYQWKDDTDISAKTIRIYQLGAELIDKLRQSHLRYSDKVALGTAAVALYEKAVKTSFDLFKKSNDYDQLNQAYNFVEKARSSVLLDNISDKEAKRFSGISDEVVKLENEIKVEISYLQSLINNYQIDEEQQESDFLDLKNRLFEYNRRLDSLNIALERNHPKYYNLKYRDKTISLEELQNRLNPSEVVLEYFEGKDLIYIFKISAGQTEVFTSPKDSILISSIETFNRHFTELQVEETNDDFMSFKTTSRTLYERILEAPINSLDESVKSITIIPTSILSTLPFEILLIDDAGDIYENLNYLFHSYAIGYAYSGSLLFQEFASGTKPQEQLLAVAPNYILEGQKEAPMNEQLTFRDELVPLKWNEPEVTSIREFFRGTTLIGPDATEKNFKKEVSKYQILHLAMHALVDHEESMQSKLVFTYDNDSTEDGMLHTYELFNMAIPAEMVVLSACNTGVGEIQTGEGITSLARAFAYAGSPSVVMSHWNANDQATSRLMKLFYKHLADGDRKDVALQKAKLIFLETANEIEANPLYWGSFVVMGNTDPLKRSEHDFPLNLVMLTLGIIALYAIARQSEKVS